MNLLEAITEKAKAFQATSVKIVANYGADGISGAALLSLTFQRLRIPFATSFVMHVDTEILEQLAKEPYETFVFVDTGAAASGTLGLVLAQKNVLIIDHHPGEQHADMLNPLQFGLEADSINSAGIAYLFCRQLWPDIRSHAHLAIVGALGDRQKMESEFHHLLLAESVSAGTLARKKGIKLLGYQTRALKHIVPECCGEHASEVLRDSELDPSLRLSALDEVQMLKLHGALEKHVGSQELQEQYLLGEMEAREFALLLEACGRSKDVGAGMGACFGDAELRKRASDSFLQFRKEMLEAKAWLAAHPEAVHLDRGLVIVNAGLAVRPQIVGALAEDLLQAYETSLVMSRMEGKTKVSLRSKKLDCLDTLQPLLQQTGGNWHGHAGAAGGCFPIAMEEAFLQLSKDTLTRIQMEETLQ